MRPFILVGLLLVHGIVSAIATWEVGYLGIFEAAFANWGAAQVFSDLGVSLVLLNAVIWLDARHRNATVWPYVVASPLLGSFAPLAYLLVREWDLRRTGSAAEVTATA